MNILFHCWEYPPHGSGVGSYIMHMAKAFRKRGHFTIVVTSYGDEGPSEEISDSGIVYRAYKTDEIGKPHITNLVLKLVKKHSVDWIEGVDRLGESSELISRSDRSPVIIKTHYNDILKASRYGHVHYAWQKPLINLACWRYRKRLAREKFSLEASDILIAPCARILDDMEKQGIRLPAHRFVVPNPITPVHGWVNMEANDPTLLLVGRIDIGKGIAHLSNIIDKLKVDFPALKIEIAGDDSYARFIGSTRSWLEKKLRSNISYVKFLGQLDQKRLNIAYSRAWVVIVPSEWDTFPTVVLESMVRKKPIVASYNGGMPEMLKGTKNIVADPASDMFAHQVKKLVSSKKLRLKAGTSGYNKAIKYYNPEHVVDDYLLKLQSCGII